MSLFSDGGNVRSCLWAVTGVTNTFALYLRSAEHQERRPCPEALADEQCILSRKRQPDSSRHEAHEENEDRRRTFIGPFFMFFMVEQGSTLDLSKIQEWRPDPISKASLSGYLVEHNADPQKHPSDLQFVRQSTRGAGSRLCSSSSSGDAHTNSRWDSFDAGGTFGLRS